MKLSSLIYSKNLFACFVLLFAFSKTFSQDSLFSKDGKIISVKVLEISRESVKYKKYSNQDGPTYDIDKNKILKIKYQNGEIEAFENEISPIKEIKTVAPTSSASEPTKKGSKVFIECQDDEIVGLKNELKNEIEAWDYWHIVYKKEEADFVLEVSTNKKAMNILTNTKVTSRAIVKSLDGANLWKSKEFGSYASIYNGYNALHASIKKLVNDGLKKKYN